MKLYLKNISTLVLAIVFALSSTGICFFEHYCSSHNKLDFYFNKKDNCCEHIHYSDHHEHDKSCVHKQNHNDIESQINCCTESLVLLKIPFLFLSSEQDSLDVKLSAIHIDFLFDISYIKKYYTYTKTIPPLIKLNMELYSLFDILLL